MINRRILALGAAAAIVVAACSGGGGTAPTAEAPSAEAPSAPAGIGPGEGELNLVIWPGYAERGEVDAAYNWVSPFEDKTGCKVNTKDMTDSNNGVALIQSGDYDGISASGDATTRLIRGGFVAPVDTSIFTNYPNVFDGLKNLPHNTVDGVNYGVPHGRGPNLLAYNTEVVTPAPTSWDPVWEGGSAYAGKISVYDSSIYIADAALHLMTKRPELGITNPYQLNEAQFAEAIKLLETGASSRTRCSRSAPVTSSSARPGSTRSTC
jgi:putative spermidine/putrescine transport system substrate-binding protein